MLQFIKRWHDETQLYKEDVSSIHTVYGCFQASNSVDLEGLLMLHKSKPFSMDYGWNQIPALRWRFLIHCKLRSSTRGQGASVLRSTYPEKYCTFLD